MQGPGHICQLALSIDDWNTTRQWWGIDTLAGNKSYQYLPLYRSDVWPGEYHALPLAGHGSDTGMAGEHLASLQSASLTACWLPPGWGLSLGGVRVAGEDWSFGFVQKRDNDTWPRVDPVFGETCDGRWFNATSIIPAPPNPAGTSASLTMTEGFGFYLPDGNKYVLYSGSVKNTGNTTIVSPRHASSRLTRHQAGPSDPGTRCWLCPPHSPESACSSRTSSTA